MARTRPRPDLADDWPAPACWRLDPLPESAQPRSVPHRSGWLTRLVAALLAADARHRAAQAMDRLSDPQRCDIGLPPRGAAAPRGGAQLW